LETRGLKYIGEHPLGMCYYSETKRHAYYNIPKNASMSLRAIFAHNSYTETNTSHIPIDTLLSIVLRDPVERFISCVNMYLGTRKTDYLYQGKQLVRNTNIDLERRYLKTNDEHFKEQTLYINYVKDFKNRDYFYLKDSTIKDITDYYKLNIEGIKRTNFKQNSSFKIITHVNKTAIQGIYNKDIDLINKIKFINDA